MTGNLEKYMGLALRLSLKAEGRTSPNPLVGAVIVKNNKIISTGFHKRAGLEHAEVVALKKAGPKARGASLYVTWEPCSSFGRTPPCVQAIIKSGIKKVIIGMLDPNPLHCGRAIKILKSNNISTKVGILDKEIRLINQPFIKYITKDTPYVTIKVAQSLDGKIATPSGGSKWITSKASRKFSHQIRNNFDAIMVGINTVLKDNPLLSPDKHIKNKKFYKIILDAYLRVGSGSRIFNDTKRYPVIIVTSKNSILKKQKIIKSLIKKGAIILGAEEKNGLLDLKYLFKKLAQLEIINILVEGGGRVVGSLLDEDLIDYALFFISPKIIGGRKAIPSIQGEGIGKISRLRKLIDVKMRNIGGDFLIQGAVRKY
jgi:diaminohydroxyphosphoribosylaminopyrimidine deaminase/5-amino-6-(5-phosphoribosylamino)uracil reductase